MKWRIPAKTFLVGEYAAMAGMPALIITTTPCFELALEPYPTDCNAIHPDSPAGRWWQQQDFPDVSFSWRDPYDGKGGMGASSAQFLGVYYASHYLTQQAIDLQQLLIDYLRCSWQQVGLAPSGYDVLAQTTAGCVYVDKSQQPMCQIYPWPFRDLGFLLLHTGKKIATHAHLQTLALPENLEVLTQIIKRAKLAFDQEDEGQLIEAVNAYQHELQQMNLIADHSLHAMQQLQTLPDILAMKGCGALGSDVLLLIVQRTAFTTLRQTLQTKGWTIIGTHETLAKNT